MHGGFIISQSDKRPMYLQIMEQIKQRIIVGDWAEGQAVPSIRQLAADLGISVITVKRAYLELEHEGVIVTQQGRGSRVASGARAGAALGARLREEQLKQHLEEAMRIAIELGIRPEQLEERLREAGDRNGVVDKEEA